MKHKDRSEQLKFCKKCSKRDFNPQKGIICSLTGEHAEFLLECDDFEIDKEEALKIDTKIKQEQAYKDKSETFGLNQLGIKNRTTAGIILISLVIVANIVTIILFNRIFIVYSLIIMAVGIQSIFIGIKNTNKKKSQNHDILDDL